MIVWFIGGFFNAFPTDQYQRIKETMNGFPSEESLKLAEELGVSFFLVEEKELLKAAAEGSIPWGSPEELYAAAETLGLKESGTFDDVHVFINR